MCNQIQQEKGTFQWLEIYKHELRSTIPQERTAKFAPPPPSPTSKEVVTGSRTLKTAPRALYFSF